MNTKKEETPRFLLFSLILHRYDLREVDGIPAVFSTFTPLPWNTQLLKSSVSVPGIAAMRTAVPLSSYTLSP